MRSAHIVAGLLILTIGACAAPMPVTIKAPSHIDPIVFGMEDLRAALKAQDYRIVDPARNLGAFEIVAGIAGANYVPPDAPVPQKAESFALVPERNSDQMFIVGSDEVGTMYGLLELAERIRMGERLEDIEPDAQSPFLQFRAMNPFLSLPYPFEGKWDNWWFLSEDFWRTYLDMLARARINWVDIHGMYDVRVTNFPNIYPYFIDSPSFPDCGIDDRQKAENLRMLQRVIQMAKARGIKIGLMSYHASWNVRGAPRAPYEETEENLAQYTRECVAGLLRACPDLGVIGFRIGESGRSEQFYKKSYLPGLEDSGLDTPLHTRTWGANKQRILEIGRKYEQPFFIEIKYNGEHYGLPYIVSGGRMGGWGHYSYQNYARPPQAYKIVWQIRANGTHRLFRWGNPDWVSRTARSCPLDGAIGFSLEAINTYYPHYDYYHKADELKWFNWVVQRDWFWYELWGRLSYDPDVRADVWVQQFAERFGEDAGEQMLRTAEQMSLIVPYIYAAHCLGPDHRNMAPEFETGRPLDEFINVPPLDTFSIQSIREYVRRLVTDSPSARTTPLQMADMIEEATGGATQAIAAAAPDIERGNREFADWKAGITCLTHLGRYYANKLRAAVQLQLYRETRDLDHWQKAKERTTAAIDQWRLLSEKADEYYVPFVDTLRMHTEDFHWKNYLDEVEDDADIVQRVKEQVQEGGGEVVDGVKAEALPEIDIDVTCELIEQDKAHKRFLIRVTGPDPFGDDATAYLRVKHLPSELDWRPRQMKLVDGAFEGEIDCLPIGMQWAVEVITPEAGACWPDWREQTPYRIVEAWEGPVPEVLERGVFPVISKLDLSREKYSALICGREAHALNGASEAEKKALLQTVADGQHLVLFNQDYPGDFDPSWLPGDIGMTDADMNDAKLLGPHPLLEGLPDKLRESKIVNDALSGGDENWQKLTDPLGLAVRKHGEGTIILCQLRILETVGNPNSERLLRNILDFARGDSDLPVMLLDEGNNAAVRAFQRLGVDYVTGYDVSY